MILTDFVILRPRNESSQTQALQWLAEAHSESERNAQQDNPNFDANAFRNRMQKLFSRYGCSPLKIDKRGHELPDFLHRNWHEMEIFNFKDAACGKGMSSRSDTYAKIVDRIFDTLYPSSSNPPPDLIHVTCTGYVSPSGAQRLVSKRGWGTMTEVTHLYQMGCAAAFPALRVAQGFASLPRASSFVDIVHTELSSLHLNPSLHEPEQLIIQSLFGDGIVRYQASSSSDRVSNQKRGLEVIALHEEIISNSADVMQWKCADWGMEMVLSREVPNVIVGELKPYLERLFQRARRQKGWKDSDLWQNAVFAVHPGGPKIIDQVESLLELSTEQVQASKNILFEYGNMSSATLPHIWQRIVADESVHIGTPIVSLAFGPGMTISGGLFKKV